MTGRAGLVAIIAGAAWSVAGFRGSERHLAEALAEAGPVLYVDPPRSPEGAVRVGLSARPGVYSSEPIPGITRISVVLPGPERPGLGRAADAALSHAVRRHVRRQHRPVAGTLVAVAHRRLLDPIPGTPRMFWATDDFESGAALMGLSAARLQWGQGRVAASGMRVLAASPELAERWEARGCAATVFPNGVDVGRFGTPRQRADRPTAVFAGQLGPRVDPVLLTAVADRVALRLVGPRLAAAQGADWDALMAHPGVTWAGPVPFENIPAQLAGADVGLVPYTASDFNRASFPLKALEYLAAGLPVVGTPLPALRWLDAPAEIRIAGTPEEFAAGAEELATAVRMELALSSQCRRIATGHDWRLRADQVRTLLAS